jgi:hypothetical protein
MRARADSPEPTGINVYLRVEGKQRGYAFNHSGGGEWETISGEIRIPFLADPNFLRLRVLQRPGDPQPAWADAVSVRIED